MTTTTRIIDATDLEKRALCEKFTNDVDQAANELFEMALALHHCKATLQTCLTANIAPPRKLLALVVDLYSRLADDDRRPLDKAEVSAHMLLGTTVIEANGDWSSPGDARAGSKSFAHNRP